MIIETGTNTQSCMLSVIGGQQNDIEVGGAGNVMTQVANGTATVDQSQAQTLALTIAQHSSAHTWVFKGGLIEVVR
jgi:hypothetical protein